MDAMYNTPYFAVCLSTSELREDVMFRVMTEKVIELAQDQPGFLYSEWISDESSQLITYWDTKDAAQAWIDNSMMRRTLSVGNQCWFDCYRLKLMEVLQEDVSVSRTSWTDSGRFPLIKTPRGVLKLLEIKDMPLLHRYVNQQKAHLEPWEPKRSDDYFTEETCYLRIKEMRKDFLEDRGCVLCLLSPEQDEMLAYSNYSQFVRGVSQSCFLGYSIAQEHQGKGLMQECLASGIHYISNDLSIDRIQACYMPRNARSAAVLKRLNFEKEGVARDYLKINGVWEDHILTALTLR